MALTAAQLTAFKADIQANTDPTVVQALADGAHNTIASWYNQNASPDYWAYKANPVSLNDVADAIELDDVANITDTDRARLDTFFLIRPGGVYANKATDRAGFDDIFSAAAGDDSQQALIALWKRLCTNAEKLFADGSGTGTNPDPDAMVFEGSVVPRDVTDALNS